MKALLISFLLLWTSSSLALQSRDLIADAESLYSSLNASAPERRAVGLRLADLCFEGAVEIDADAKASTADSKRADQYRRRAFQLYSDTLPSLKGLQAVRVRFQLSRLHVYAARIDRAIALWKVLIQQTEDTRIRRESALHLAEQYELSSRRELVLQAVDMYNLALPLAETRDLQSYIHFRTGWTRFRLGQGDLAITQMRKSIAMSDKNEKVSRIKDLTLFLSRSEISAEEGMKVLRSYESELEGTDLLPKLADAYLAADRREDYASVTKLLNKRAPTLDRSVALLDTNHDQMDQKQLLKDLNSLIDLRKSGGRFSDKANETKARDSIFRLVIIWDGQRKAGKSGYDQIFTAGVNVMVYLFPQSEETEKSVGSWLAMKAPPETRKEQVEEWIPMVRNARNPKFEIALRRERLELSRQLKEWNEVVVETNKLEPIVPASERRELQYQRAKAYHEQKNYASALPLFIQVADAKGVRDEFTKFSQDLALNIVGEQKDYSQAIALSERWKSIRPDFAETAEKARFERAAESQDATALTEFTKFCVNKKFLPKSCENAEALALKLGDRATLVTLLRVQGKEDELARQLEFGARFNESARILEKKLTKNSTLVDNLKVALLYELEGTLSERDRVLKNLTNTLPGKIAKLSNEERQLIYQTLRDAGLVTDATLKWDWPADMKLAIATDIAAKGAPAPNATQILSASCENAGPQWEKLHLDRLAKSYKDLSAISFYGRSGEAKFKKRAEALKKFSEQSDCFAKTETPILRYATLSKVAQAYEEFSKEIQGAPIPDGIDEETKQEVVAKIAAVAEPFDKLALTWREAAQPMLAQIPEGERIDPKAWNFTSNAAIASARARSKPLAFDWKVELEALRKNPGDRQTLEKLKLHFEEKGSPRLAAYFGGRLEGLEQQ